MNLNFWGKIPFAVFLLLSVGACTLLEEEEHNEEDAKKHAAERKQWFADTAGKALPSPSDTSEMIKEPPAESKLEERGNPYPIYRAVPMQGDRQVGQSDAKPLFDSRERLKVELDFNAAEIGEVVPVFADLLNFDYQLDAAWKNTVTLHLSEQLTKQEIWELFKKVLHHVGGYVSIDRKLMVVKPLENLPLDTGIASADAHAEFAVFRFQNISAKDAAAQIGVFLSRGNKPLLLEKRNMLIIFDTKDVITKLRGIIGEFDRPIRDNWAKMVIPCRNIDAKRLAYELGEILPILGFPVATNEKAQPEEIQLVAVDRLQILVASAASGEALNELGRWAGVLDQTGAGEQEKIYVYNIVNGNAEELVKALSVMFPVEGMTLTPGGSGEGATKTAAQDATISSQAKTTGKEEKQGQASVFETPVKIFADAMHERLLIRTKPRAFAMIKALLEKIDTIPSQVLLQAMIVEIVLNDSIKFGIEFMMSGTSGNTGISGGTNYSGLVPAEGQTAQSGGRFYIFNPDNPNEKFGYINALAGKTNIKVVANPQLLIASRNEAKISIGQKVPIVNSEITNTQSSTIADTNLVRNIQYQDTGIILKITPRVTRGGRINLVLEQTVSEADQNATSDIDSPTIKEQIINTTMSIRDGQTVICGGMIQEKVSDSLSTIPIIGEIPFLKRLFGDTNRSSERTEMLILITGTIITENTQLEELLKKYQESVNALMEFNRSAVTPKEKRQQGVGSKWFIE